jgi:hypothetical protein
MQESEARECSNRRQFGAEIGMQSQTNAHEASSWAEKKGHNLMVWSMLLRNGENANVDGQGMVLQWGTLTCAMPRLRQARQAEHVLT